MILLLAIIISLTIGENGLSIQQILNIQKLDTNSIEYTIFTNIRLPRVIIAISVGGMLSFSGLIMQNIFRNPLVEPYTMGLSGGAVIGVAIVFSTELINNYGTIAITTGALIGALSTMILILTLYKTLLHNTAKMLLSGIMISFATSSITTLIMSLSTQENISQIISWTMGSFDNATIEQAKILLYITIAIFIASIFSGNILNIISLGETSAQHLGQNVKIIIPTLFIIATATAAISVAFAGVIAFVGMIVPHILRLTLDYDNRILAPMSFIFGATFMLICDTIAHNIIYPREIPVGVISGIIGCILFIYLSSNKK